MADIEVFRVIIKKPGGDQAVTVKDYLNLSPVEQTDLILENKLTFIDHKGNLIPIKDAIANLRKGNK